MLQFLRDGGVPEPWNVTDVWGLDEAMLNCVPAPCKALILLFPMTEAVSVLTQSYFCFAQIHASLFNTLSERKLYEETRGRVGHQRNPRHAVLHEADGKLETRETFF